MIHTLAVARGHAHGANTPQTCLQPILDHVIFNWYSNNVRALTREMHALQFDQLSEQILFLLDCVWYTPQSNDTKFDQSQMRQLYIKHFFPRPIHDHDEDEHSRNDGW